MVRTLEKKTTKYQESEHTKKKQRIRILIYVLVCISMLMASFSIWQYQTSRSVSLMNANTEAKINTFASETELRFNRIYSGLERLSDRYLFNQAVEENNWNKDAQYFINAFSGVSEIYLVNNNLVIVKGISDDLSLTDGDKITGLINSDKIVILHPIYYQNQLEGFICGVVDIEEFLSPIHQEIGTKYLIQIKKEQVVLYQSAEWDIKESEREKRVIIVLENSATWELALLPTTELYNITIKEPNNILLYGILLSFFVIVILYFIDSYFKKSVMLAYKNKSEEKYRLVTENTSDVIWVYNSTKKYFTFISPSIYELRGITSEQALLEKMEETMTKDSYSQFLLAIENKIYNEVLLEVLQYHNDKKTIWVEMSVKININEIGETEITGVSRNINTRKHSEEKILYMNSHDYLTTVFNRRFFEKQLKIINRKENYPLSIVLLDVNGLKLINDSFGHITGDKLLIKLASIIKAMSRTNDIVARIGGDEFVMLLPLTSEEDTEEIITQIKQKTSNEEIEGITISVSAGFATKTHNNSTIEEIFKYAENNMYRNKLYESSSARNKTIDVVINTLYEKSPREMQHSRRVSQISKQIAIAMGFDENNINKMIVAGLMHDIGKIGIDEGILNKTGRLTELEWEEMKKHPEIGYRILSSANEFSEISDYVLQHQERWDGKGYPQGLSGQDIFIQARIITIADSFDAMTSDRSYRKKLSYIEAADEIKKCAGTHFDPELVHIFLSQCLPVYVKEGKG